MERRPRRAGLGRAHAPPRLHPLCRAGRRRRRRRHRHDGTAGTGGPARHPHEPARDCAGRSPDGGVQGRARGDGAARHIQRERLRLLPGNGHAAANDRLRPAGLTSRPGRLAARPRHRQLLQDRQRLRRRQARGQPHAGPHPRQHHAVLADWHRRLGRPVLLGGRTSASSGTRVRPGSSTGLAPGWLHHLPRRDLANPAQLGRELLPERHLLQRGGQGRTLRRLGRAAALLRGAPGCLRLSALIRANERRARPCAPLAAGRGPDASTRERRRPTLQGVADVRKVVTVVFTDVAGSTRLGEQLDPETARLVMSRYFDTMQSVVEAHGGIVEKFIGDAIMAVFGLPTLHEDDALRAVRAAVEMRESRTGLNEQRQRDHGLTLAARTGVNTGEVIAGGTASEQKLATGDAVNVAARLEQAAAAGQILIGEATYRLLDGTVHAEPVQPLELKGKAAPVPAWRVSRLQPETSTPAPITFVGRTRELDLLRESFATATRERTCVVATVVAPPGMGKSTLARELTSGLDARIAVGRCLAYGESITYAPLGEITRQLDPPGSEIAPFVAAALGRSDEQVTPEQIAWGFRKL